MTENLNPLLIEISNSLADLDKIFSKLSNNYYIQSNINDNDGSSYYIEEHNNRLESEFEITTYKLYNMLCLYFEKLRLFEYLKQFKSEFNIYITDPKKQHETFFAPDIEELYNQFIFKLNQFLAGFIELKNKKYNEEYLLKTSGMYYLRNLIRGTSSILYGKQIDNEPTISKYKKNICTSIFPDAQFPTEPFIKTAKQYKPDILIPSLNCAIEYKYALDEKRLITTIDEILIDVNGYNNNRIYKLFIAAFYIKAGICTEQRFNEIWKEKSFPKNWEAIFIPG